MMDKEDYERQQEELARHAASEGAWYWNRFHTVTPLTLKRAHMFGFIWLAFCSLKIWREDKESDPDAYKSIEGQIFYYAALWATMMISKTYEITAKNYLGYRWEYYSNGFKEAEDHSTLFPSVIFRSIGKKTFEDTGALDNPMATLNLDWIKMYMCANGYTIDRSNVPYSIFKSMVRGWRDLTGENVDEDSQFDDTD
jgi:hypothetical protein